MRSSLSWLDILEIPELVAYSCGWTPLCQGCHPDDDDDGDDEKDDDDESEEAGGGARQSVDSRM